MVHILILFSYQMRFCKLEVEANKQRRRNSWIMKLISLLM